MTAHEHQTPTNTRSHGRRGDNVTGRQTPWLCTVDRRKAVRRAIRAAGAKLLFLPPYSLDLNPIEQLFAKLKTLLRKAAERSVEATWQRIGQLLDSFTPTECANYIANAGYGST